MNYSNSYLYELQAQHRKAVYCDFERHFSSIDSPKAEEVLALLSHIPFNELLAYDCDLGDFGQFTLTVGSPEDEMEMCPFWALSTGITANITIYAPTTLSQKSDFYKELMEHMFHQPATEDLVRWWSDSKQFPSRITLDFSEGDAALCDVVIELCSAASHVTEQPWGIN